MGRFRFTFLIIGSVAAYGFLLFRVYDIQLRSGDAYYAQAESQSEASVFTRSQRGAIYFTDKSETRRPAAINKDFPRIFANPKLILDPTAAAHAVAPILEMDVKDLQKQFSKKTSYILLGKRADAETAQRISDLEIKGIIVQNVSERLYPFGSLASHLLGYTGPNDKDNGSGGRYGVEEKYNNFLSGDKNGKDVFLTIDSNIQKEAERILDNVIKKYNATGGTVIVQEPKTGKILAFGNYPNFDPNAYSKYPVKNFLNPATEQIYEPGSVFKVLTMAAGIDSGKITPETSFMDEGKLVFGEHTIRNWDLKAHGRVTMTNVIELSLNTGAAFAQKQTGDKVFRSYLEKFGFGSKTGIDLPGELKGDLRTINLKEPPVNFATASFGQGVSVTPIQMINAFNAIANGGKLMKPYVNIDTKPQIVEKVITNETAKKVTAMMVSAVDKAEVAKISGYSIAGKTGTAQVPENGGYSKRVINTYIGFGPAEDAKFTILFKVNEPEGAPLAGQTVVPAFRDLAQFIINYYNLPPDRVTE